MPVDEANVALLYDLRQQSKELDARIKQLSTQIVSEGVDTFSTDAYKVSVRRSKRRTIDVERLRHMIPSDLFKAVTTPVIDSDEFEKRFNAEEISNDVIEECVTYVPRGPVVYVTIRKDTVK